jgi:mannan endo-1,4-beta-mannosidase
VFKSINDLVSVQYKKRRGLIGLAPWSYGGIYRSNSQHYNNQGIVIAGDPPQEREYGVRSATLSRLTVMLL